MSLNISLPVDSVCSFASTVLAVGSSKPARKGGIMKCDVEAKEAVAAPESVLGMIQS
jgi:hypothetical protein